MCVSSIGCPPGTVKLFDSFYHDIISQEVEDQVKDLLADSFQKLEYTPCQQQMAVIAGHSPLLLQQVLF